MCPLFWITKTLIMIIVLRLIVFFLLQSMINSPHAYEQNKAFTKQIVDVMMKALEEKLELEVSIPRKLHDEWEPTIKFKIKNYEFFLYVI